MTTLKELVKCEECPFYEQCIAMGEKHWCPAAKNFDILINEIIDAEDIKTLKEDTSRVVKDIIQRYGGK